MFINDIKHFINQKPTYKLKHLLIMGQVTRKGPNLCKNQVDSEIYRKYNHLN